MVQYSHPEIARKKLVERILPKAGVRDVRILAAFAAVPRHLFVEEAFQSRAYEDTSLPIGFGQTISQPSTLAAILQVLELSEKDRVLEIGGGSGYQTALLAHLAQRVFSMERVAPLSKLAWRRLDRLGLSNVALRIGDGTYGWPEQGPFEAIVVSAMSPRVPDYLIAQLRVGGRMVIPLGDSRSQRLVKVIRRPSGVDRVDLAACQFVPLIGRFGWEKKSPAREGETGGMDS